MQGLKQTLRHPLTSVGLGLSAIATTAIGLWPPKGTEFDPEKAFAFASALCLWMYSEIFVEKSDNSNHDEKLSEHDTSVGEEFCEIANDNFVDFLESHEFGLSWWNEYATPIYDISRFSKDPKHSFQDEQLSEQLEVIVRLANSLGYKLAMWGAPINGRELHSMIPDRERLIDEFSPQTLEKVESVNTEADDLARHIREIYKLLRDKGVNLIVR